MIVPVGDVTPRRTVPFINYLLILANVVVFFLYCFPVLRDEAILARYALRPSGEAWRTIFTSMFLHANIEHLLGNMLFLWIAGDNVEDVLGHLPYLVFYLVCGLGGSLVHLAVAPMAGKYTVGASGAISGVMGAYLVFFPASKIRFALWLIIFIRFFTLPSWGAIGLWVAMQLVMARHQLSGTAGQAAAVAVFAHLGGFAFGFGAAALLRLTGRVKARPARK